MEKYPQEFIDYLCDMFGLEWLDYCDEQNFAQWCELKLAEN